MSSTYTFVGYIENDTVNAIRCRTDLPKEIKIKQVVFALGDVTYVEFKIQEQITIYNTRTPGLHIESHSLTYLEAKIKKASKLANAFGLPEPSVITFSIVSTHMHTNKISKLA